jgi:hypothetical protein
LFRINVLLALFLYKKENHEIIQTPITNNTINSTNQLTTTPSASISVVRNLIDNLETNSSSHPNGFKLSSSNFKFSSSTSTINNHNNSSPSSSATHHHRHHNHYNNTDTDDAKMMLSNSSRTRSNSSSNEQSVHMIAQTTHSTNMTNLRNFSSNIYSTLPLNKNNSVCSSSSSSSVLNLNTQQSNITSGSTSTTIQPPSTTISTDALANLVKQYGVSKRNALMKWCQERIGDYKGVEIKNFSSSWNDGLAFCALMHSFLPNKIDYEQLRKENNARKNFMSAFQLAQSQGIEQTLNINDLLNHERPDWNAVMNYVTLIYKHFHQQHHNHHNLIHNLQSCSGISSSSSSSASSDEEKVTTSISSSSSSSSSGVPSTASSPIRSSSSNTNSLIINTTSYSTTK